MAYDNKNRVAILIQQVGKALAKNETTILSGSISRFKGLPDAPYKHLLLDTSEGVSRMQKWTHLAIGAFCGKEEDFHHDMSTIGYKRAQQGFAFSDLIKVQHFYIQSVFDFLQDNPGLYSSSHNNLLIILKRLIDIAYETVIRTANSLITTREEIIAEKVDVLQRIYQYTKKLITSFSMEHIIKLTHEELMDFFGASHCDVIVLPSRISGRRDSAKAYFNAIKWQNYALRSYLENIEVFLNVINGSVEEVTINDNKQVVITPIRVADANHGVVIISNLEENIDFGEEQANFLDQLFHVTSMMISNSRMVDQIERHATRLRLLTLRTLDSNEQERKVISEDIHDTLTQTLTGINYRLQYCQTIADPNNSTLHDELKNLSLEIEEAINQCRSIIASLHPDIIDNIGLTSALDSYLSAYTDRTGITVRLNCDEILNLPSPLTIAIYRIAQEGLTNIAKHSDASAATIILRYFDNCVKMSIEDNGSSVFNTSNDLISPENGKFGLFYIQQRVEALKGTLDIEAIPDGGLKLVVAIPVEHE